MVRMAYPPGQGPSIETLPLPPPPSSGKREPIVFAEGVKHQLTEGTRISGAAQIAPDDDTKTAIARSGVERVTGTFRACLDEDGHVESVLPLRSTGIANYDREILAGMRTWIYSPYQVDGQRVPVCTAITFIYSQAAPARWRRL